MPLDIAPDMFPTWEALHAAQHRSLAEYFQTHPDSTLDDWAEDCATDSGPALVYATFEVTDTIFDEEPDGTTHLLVTDDNGSTCPTSTTCASESQ